MTLISLARVLPRVPATVGMAGGDATARWIADNYAAESFVFRWHHGAASRQVLYAERAA